MSEVVDSAGWWLASDGNWYPPDTSPSAPAVPPLQLPPLVMPPAYSQGSPVDTVIPTGPPPSPWSVDAPTYPGTPPIGAGYPAPYPYPYAPGPGLPNPKTSPMAVWALVLVIVLGAIGALVGIPLAFVARSRIRQSGGALKGSGLALAALIIGFAYVALIGLAIAIPTFLGVTHSGPALQNLNYSVQGQITGTAPNDFGVASVSEVSCQPPSQWTTGSMFTCVANGTSGSEIGRYYGTVAPNASDGTYQWNGRYVPSG